MREEIVNIVIVVSVFMLGVLFGNTIALPGYSESHTILAKHGKVRTLDNSALLYIPDTDMSVEEYEAIAKLSKVYEHVAIIADYHED